MKRKAELYLQTWFSKKTRAPLIIRGARQVGKSTLVKLFCEKANLDLIEINLEKMSLSSLKQDSIDLTAILDEIQIKSKKRITSNSLLFLDEIQEAPLLIKALRYFFEERPEIAVICAGSLLEITLKKDPITFPVGRVEFFHLGPMTFSEFLWATGNELLDEKISQGDFSSYVLEEAKKLLRIYYYVGGMPKAVKTYIEDGGSLLSVRDIQNQIIQTYSADFPKYNPRIQTDRIQKVFLSTINQLGKKVIYQRLDPEAHSRDTKRIINLLIDARVLLECKHSDANSIPLAGESSDSIYKLYFLDVGLVNAILKLDLDIIDEEMKNNFNTKGMIAEQFVAQHLAYLGNESTGPELHYWLRDKGSQKGEIDFLIQDKDKIIPIEVKASAAGHLKSLFYFCKEKKKNFAIKISLETLKREEVKHKINELDVNIELMNLPQFAVEYLYFLKNRL